MDSSTLLFLNIGGPEMIMIFFVVLLLFGGKKLPELARGLGKGLREFKDASEGIKREIHNNINAVSDVASDVTSDITSAMDVPSSSTQTTEETTPAIDAVPQFSAPEGAVTFGEEAPVTADGEEKNVTH